MDKYRYGYSDDDPSIDSTANQLLLRVDLHGAHEQSKGLVFSKVASKSNRAGLPRKQIIIISFAK